MSRYTNPHLRNMRRTFWDFLLWQVGYYKDAQSRETPPQDFVYPGEPSPFDRTQPYIFWVGHSSFLIEIDGHTLLTDPIWDQYCSPLPIPTLKRRTELPIPLADLPPIDFVLLSHNHYDHLDEKTVLYLKKAHPQIEWIVHSGLS